MSPSDRPELPSIMLNPRLLAARDGDVSPRRAGLHRVAAAARLLIEGMVGTDLDDDQLRSTAEALEQLASTFDRDGPRSIYDGIAELAMAGADPAAFFDHSPFIGRANPLSPPITLDVVDDVVVGTVVFGSAYEGPPGAVHGGYVAAAFDEVLGSAQTFSGLPGMTGSLTIHYRRPTPLHAPLRFEGRMVRKDGRKVFTEGRLYCADLLTAEAEGLFISIDVEKFRSMREARDARLRPESREDGRAHDAPDA